MMLQLGVLDDVRERLGRFGGRGRLGGCRFLCADGAALAGAAKVSARVNAMAE
jgi:hypothetical protein